MSRSWRLPSEVARFVQHPDEPGRDLLEVLASHEGGPVALKVSVVSGSTRRCFSSSLGEHDDASSSVVRIGNSLDIAAALQVRDQLTHGLWADPGTAGQNRRAGTVTVEELEHVGEVGGAHILVARVSEVILKAIEKLVEDQRDELGQC